MGNSTQQRTATTERHLPLASRVVTLVDQQQLFSEPHHDALINLHVQDQPHWRMHSLRHRLCSRAPLLFPGQDALLEAGVWQQLICP